MSVIVYTTPTCGYCHQVKMYLQRRNVPFAEVDVSRNPRAAAEMVRLSGQQGVPVVTVDDQVVVGFNQPAIDQLLTRRMSQFPKLGVSVADAATMAAKKGLSLPTGALVGRVTPRSAAAWAGVQVGDVIVQLAGQPVRSDADVHRIMAGLRNNQTAPLVVWRTGQQLNLQVGF